MATDKQPIIKINTLRYLISLKSDKGELIMIASDLKKKKLHHTSTLMRNLRSSTAVPVFMLFLLVQVVAEPVKLHPIGDSTTENHELETAWRYHLYKKLVKNGYVNVDFVGSRCGTYYGTEFEDKDWDMDHNAYSSARSTQILNGNLPNGHEGCIKEWAPKFTPHIAVIYLATNDVRGRRRTADIIETLKSIIQVLRDARKEVKIVMCQIPYWKFGRYGGSQSAVDALNVAISSLKTSGADISPIKIVDLNTNYDLKDHRDGIHPGPTGAVKIANRLYEAVTPWLNDNKITANHKMHIINQPGQRGVKRNLSLTIQDNMTSRIWISVEPVSDIRKRQGYLITGRKITAR